MAALIQKPDELFLADTVWAGAEFIRENHIKMEEEEDEDEEEEKERKLKECPEQNAAEYLAFAIKTHEEGDLDLEMDTGTGGKIDGKDGKGEKAEKAAVQETPEVIDYALKEGAEMIAKLSASVLGKRSRGAVDEEEKEQKMELDSANSEDVKMEIDDDEPSTKSKPKLDPSDATSTEDHEPLLKKLRLNLLALAKRAPLDTVATLPADLVPAHIRAYVPTLATIPPTTSSASASISASLPTTSSAATLTASVSSTSTSTAPITPIVVTAPSASAVLPTPTASAVNPST